MLTWLKRLAFVVLFACACGALAAWFYMPPARVSDRETYAVLYAYIAGGLTGDSHDFGSPNGLVVIADHSVNGMFRVLPPTRLPEVSRAMRYELALRSLFLHRLSARFDLPAHYKLVHSTSLEEPDLTPEEQRRSYGLLTFSAVSFNHNATQALFYTEHLCGLCGGGEFVLVRKDGDTWKVIDEQGTWIS